ncbi:hypothetical protein ES703_93136 [subsurface metagenome]
MATIVFADGVDPIKGHRRGIAFDISQAGHIAKRRPSPINHLTNPRMLVRSLLPFTNQYFWNMTNGQKTAWANLAAMAGVTGPFGQGGHQAGCAMFFKLVLNAQLAGDPIYANHPAHNPVTPPTWLTLTRIDKDTIRVTFTASAQWVTKRIYLRQAIPSPGHRNWKPTDGYIAQYSPLNPNSPTDFTTHFQHIAGWNGRYWLGTQRTCGCRSAETLWDL